MKQATKLSVFLIMLAVVSMMGSCDQKKGTKTAYYFLFDNTSITKSRLGLIEPMNVIGDILGKDSSGTGSACFRSINSVELNPTRRISLDYDGGLMGDVDYKVLGEIKIFKDSLISVLTRELEASAGDAHSSIWQPFCQAVNELQEEQANRRILVVESDMVEYSGDGNNFYKNIDNKDTIDAKIARLELRCKLPEDCNNVKVVIVFNPNLTSTPEKDQKDFDKAMLVWKEIFKRHSIVYKVTPNY